MVRHQRVFSGRNGTVRVTLLPGLEPSVMSILIFGVGDKARLARKPLAEPDRVAAFDVTAPSAISTVAA